MSYFLYTANVSPAISIDERCPNLSLACLSAQPEWNPTLSAPGITRITAEELRPFDTEKQYELVSKTFTNNNLEDWVTRTYQYYAIQHDTDYCGSDVLPVNRKLQRCPYRFADEYDQIAFYSQAGDVLHAFQLDEGWSIQPVTSTSDAPVSGVVLTTDDDAMPLGVAAVRIFNWKKAVAYATHSVAEESYEYILDLTTGEFISENHQPITSDTDMARTFDYTAQTVIDDICPDLSLPVSLHSPNGIQHSPRQASRVSQPMSCDRLIRRGSTILDLLLIMFPEDTNVRINYILC